MAIEVHPAAGVLARQRDDAGAGTLRRIALYVRQPSLVPVALALAEGESVYTVSEVTEHLRTNAATIQEFLDRGIRIEESIPDALARVIVEA